jgi:hypothetical protein
MVAGVHHVEVAAFEIGGRGDRAAAELGLRARSIRKADDPGTDQRGDHPVRCDLADPAIAGVVDIDVAFRIDVHTGRSARRSPGRPHSLARRFWHRCSQRRPV